MKRTDLVAKCKCSESSLINWQLVANMLVINARLTNADRNRWSLASGLGRSAVALLSHNLLENPKLIIPADSPHNGAGCRPISSQHLESRVWKKYPQTFWMAPMETLSFLCSATDTPRCSIWANKWCIFALDNDKKITEWKGRAGRKCGPRSGQGKENPVSYTAIQANQSLLFGHKIMAARSDYLIILNRYSSTRISGLLTNILRSPL